MSRRLAAFAAIVCGLVALAARPLSSDAVLVTATVGVIGVRPLWSAPSSPSSIGRWAAVTATGVLAVTIASAAGNTPASVVAPIAVAASLLAAVSEEAFFRGYVYRQLEDRGSAVAIGIAALAFAAVHLPMYGWPSAPVNLAAGLLLGWQRWAAGTWSAPAVTHAVANLLAVAWT